MGQRHGLEIRTVAGSDAPGVAALLAASGCPMPISGDRLDALRHRSGTAFLALEWGPPSGIVVLHWAATLLDGAPVALITTLLVAPDDRRRGIGRQLLKSAAQAARMAGCDSLHLLRVPDAPDLAAFCAATGFTAGAGGFVRPLRKRG